jgi:hypothetical protein
MNFGWTAQGHEVAVSLNPGSDYLQMVRLDTGQVYNLYPQAKLGWDPGTLHTYMNQHGWAFINTYASNNDYWDSNQIFAIELDENKCDAWYDALSVGEAHSCRGGKARIWRVSFTQNVTGKAYYFRQANVQANYAGTKLWFGANWRDINNPPDVYQIDLPPDWVADLAKHPGSAPK